MKSILKDSILIYYRILFFKNIRKKSMYIVERVKFKLISIIVILRSN